MTISPELEAFARAISRVLGWAYFLSWSVPAIPRHALYDPILTHDQVSVFLPPTYIELYPQIHALSRNRFPHPQCPRFHLLYHLYSLLPIFAYYQIAICVPSSGSASDDSTI